MTIAISLQDFQPGGLRKTIFSARLLFGRSRSSKVIDFGNRKRVCDLLLLVRHSNLGPISHRFRDIAGFLFKNWPHPYSTLILGVFPLHQIIHVGGSPRIRLKLFGREIILEEFQPIGPRHLNVTDGVTDRRHITALCVASHGKM